MTNTAESTPSTRRPTNSLREGLVFDADILGSSNKQTGRFLSVEGPDYSEDEYRGWFGKRKPCIKGSDSHNAQRRNRRLKDHNSKPTDSYCWIKADPTFSGLRQIINEPEDRVFIGALPPKLERRAGQQDALSLRSEDRKDRRRAKRRIRGSTAT